MLSFLAREGLPKEISRRHLEMKVCGVDTGVPAHELQEDGGILCHGLPPPSCKAYVSIKPEEEKLRPLEMLSLNRLLFGLLL